MDGFDSQDLTRWTVSGGPTLVAGRIGGSAVKMIDGALLVRYPTTLSTIGFGVAFKCITNALNPTVIRLMSGGTNMLILSGSTSGWTITYWSISSGVQTPLTAVTVGNWEHFDILYTSHSTTGRVLVKQNGNVVFDFTGNTSTYGSVAPIDNVVIAGGYESQYAVDDIWVSTGESYGDSRVRGLVPTADSTTAWATSTGTSHFALVDEIPPSMTDYVSATGGSGLQDKFTLTVPGDLTAVTAVQVNAYGLKTDAGTAPLRLIADTQESANIGFSTTAGGISAIFPTAAAGAAWTPAKLAAAGAVGIKAV